MTLGGATQRWVFRNPLAHARGSEAQARLFRQLLSSDREGDGCLWLFKSYFPMQNVAKIRFRISSAVVAPVMASSGRSAA